MPSRRRVRRGKRSAPRRGGNGGGSSGIPPRPLAGSGALFNLRRSVQAVNGGTITAGSPLLASLVLLMGSGGSFPTNMRSFMQLWDYMWIRKIRIRFVPRWSVGCTGSIPQLAAVANYDDASAPSTFDTVLGQGGSRNWKWDRPRAITVTPAAVIGVVVTGATFTGVGLDHALWLNTQYVGVATAFMPICKYAINAVTTVPGTDGAFDIYYDYDILLRQALTG